MGRRRKFGRTWWGNAWIEALNDLGSTFSNRLPRGYRYAVNGAVKKIEIKSGEVYALVQGRLPQPYKVKIILKHFTKEQKKKIAELISKEPIISAKLLSSEMPRELEDVLSREGLSILPRDTSEFKLHCSCPDWAVPCKHISAVFYILANEIDKNPFILFELRGINPEDILSSIKVAPREIKHFLLTKDEITSNVAEDFDDVNLSIKKEATPIILGLLSENPLFYEKGDFKNVLSDIYRKVSKSARIDILEERESDPRLRFVDVFLYFKEKDFGLPEVMLMFKSDVLNEEELRYVLSGLLGEEVEIKRVEIKSLKTGKENKSRRTMLGINLADVRHTLYHLSLRLVASRSLRQLIFMAHFALSLMRNGYFIPEVLVDEKQNFIIYYKPIYLTYEVRKTFDNFVKRLDEKYFRTREHFVDRKSALNTFVTRMITFAVHDTFASMEKESTEEDEYDIHGYYFEPVPDNDKEIKDTFLTPKVYIADKFEKKNTANAIKQWLAVFQIQELVRKPTLRLIPPRRQDGKWKLHLYFLDQAGYIPAKELLHEESVQKIIYTLSNYYAPLSKFLKRREAVSIDIDELLELVKSKKDLLMHLGLTLALPKESEFVTSIFPVIKFKKSKSPTSPPEGGLGFLTLSEIVSTDVLVKLGDEEISLSEFKKLMKAGKRAVLFKNKWVILTPQEIEKIFKAEEYAKRKITVQESIRLVLAGETKYNGVNILFTSDEELKNIINTLKNPSNIPIPATLHGTLREYQKRGYRWIVTNLKMGFSPCIADDMGLGKTVQVIASILHFKERGALKDPVLVVCPTSLVGNWAREIKKFAPSLSWSIYHGHKRKLDRKNDIIITSYNLVRIDYSKFAKHRWSIIILDEAQNIKNPNAQKTKAVKSLKTNLRIAMTGTPLENRLLELWSIMDFLNLGYLGSKKFFLENYAIPIERYGDLRKANELRRVIAPFILRRLKTDKNIIKDLPEKVEIDKYCNLTKEQLMLYKSTVENELKEIEAAEGIRRKGNVLKLILHLKQICNHPSQFLKRPIAEIEASGKMLVLRNIVEDILAGGEKLLIFTQYKEMAKLIKDTLSREFNATIELFTGELSRKKREEVIRHFEKGYIDILILTIKAGGTGLNLVEANNVVHYDLWWNPAVENQATDRTYRIGQIKNVFVYRLIAEGTIEDKINELLKRKKELAELVITSGEKWITELSTEELKELVSLAS